MRLEPTTQPTLDPDSAARDAFFALIDRYKWPCAIAFVGGCYFTLAAAWVWSWYL